MSGTVTRKIAQTTKNRSTICRRHIEHKDRVRSRRSAFDAFGSVRARADLAAGRALFYLTAGPAWSHFNSLTTAYSGSYSSPIRDLIPDDTWHLGVAAGVGVEFMVTPNWSVRGEYLYLDFSDALVHYQQVCCGSSDATFRRSYSYSAEIARIGANYRF